MGKNNIFLKSRGLPTIQHGRASEVITPGHLIEFGGANDLQKHSTAGGSARKAFANRQYIGKGIEDAFAVGELVDYAVAERGDEVNALIAANAPAIAKGDPLESAGDGTLRKHVPQAVNEGGTATYNVVLDAIVAYATGALDNSANGSAVRLEVEVA